jgi:hypothetical protein
LTTDGRLSTELWVQAHLRICNADGRFAAVLHKGDQWGGAVIVKLNLLDGRFKVLSQTRDMEGRVAWLAAQQGAFLAEADASAYIDRQVKRDPDLWVIEIEDRQGRNPFEGKDV